MTLEGLSTQESVLKDLELHFNMAHGAGGAGGGARAPVSDIKPDKFPRPEIADPATDTDWQYFQASWESYKRATKITGQNACDQLWHCPTDSLKKKVFDSGVRPTMTEEQIMTGIKRLAVKAHNNMINIVHFQSLCQERDELVPQFAARLTGGAAICDFTVECKCKESVSYSEAMQSFQLIRGLYDTDIQEKILADAANTVLTLPDIVKISEAIESGKRSSGVLSRSGGLNRISEEVERKSKKTCAYCGGPWHDGPGWRKRCKGTTSTCSTCSRKGHLPGTLVCKRGSKKDDKETNSIDANQPETPTPTQQGETASMNLGFFCTMTAGINKLSHVGINEFGKWAKVRVEDHPEVVVEIKPDVDGYGELDLQPRPPHQHKTTKTKSLVDTGAQMVVVDVRTVYAMGLGRKHIIPVGMTIKAANTGGLKLLGGVLVRISGKDQQGNERVTRQLAYVAEEVNRVFLSRQASEDLGIIDKTFPTIGAYGIESDDATKEVEEDVVRNDVFINGIKNFKACEGLDNGQCSCPKRELPPPAPESCPFPPNPENLERLEGWIRDKYRASTFNTCNCQPLPLMQDSPPLELFIDPSAKPVACHKPAQVPIHFKERVEADLWRDVRLGVLEEVPPNTPTTWCSRMCIQVKKNGKPRRTIDLQALNKHAVRQTHAGETPFHIASDVPPNTYRTTTDAWNGYHSVPIKEEDRHVTTFITPWGRFRYRTTPQGFLAAMDAYNHRFDLITRDVKDKKRCVDDSILWGDNIEENFIKTCQYLTLTGGAGIIMNPDKFVFCKKKLEFLGFELTEDGVEPGRELLKSILDFPRPRDITGIRSWFGLVEQVAWAFSKTNVMNPLRHLLSPSSEFVWNQELNDAFERSKQEIVNAVKRGVKSFDPKRTTCIATDWSKLGIGFCLLQKVCTCTEITPVCCPEGWVLVLCNSRYTSPAESRYSPVEGECLGVAWSLKKAKYFVLGCENLVVAVDHKPLLGVLGDKSLDDIDNTRLANLKEKTLRYKFSIVHVPGVKNKVADASSRYPTSDPDHLDLASLQAGGASERLTRELVRAAMQDPSEVDVKDTASIEESVEAALQATIASISIGGSGGNCQAVTWEAVVKESTTDQETRQLVNLVRNGIPESREHWPQNLSDFYRARNDLCEKDGVVKYKKRVVIPKSLRKEVLDILHAAHQGCSSMEARASQSVWWPGMKDQIARRRAACQGCTQAAPSQPSLPPVRPPSPDYPMQQICSDIAHYSGHTYVVIVDRFSNWPSVYKSQRAEGLVKALRWHFIAHGAAEEISSDGGPEYTATETEQFLKRWGVAHRLSSAYHPHANLRAELGVKIVKRMLRENISPNGGLDTDKFGRALLAYRNTPCKDLGVSPAQILYGRTLRDHLPTPMDCLKQRKEWILLKADREKALSAKYGRVQEDLERHSRQLPPLPVGAVVQVQNQRGKDPLRWDRSGIVVENLGNQQYTIKMDGSGRVSLRNRQFLRIIKPFGPRYVMMENVPVNHHDVVDQEATKGGDDEVPGNATEDQVDDRNIRVEDEEQRRSIRIRRAPNWYQAK